MKTLSIALAGAGLCLGLSFSPAFAASHVGAPMGSSAKKQAEADYKAAKKSCKTMKRAEKKACEKEAKATYDTARKGGATMGGATNAPSNGSAPAVQTQSPAVSSTGVAPSPVGPDKAPGTPAQPKKP